MSCFAVIDTNVLVSALLSSNNDAATVKVMAKVLGGEIIQIYSDHITAEYRAVLARPKFGFPPELAELLIASIEKFGIPTEPAASGLTLPDMKDLPFYEVVLEKRSDGAYLVTGNLKHFPREPFIVTPRELLDILENS